MRDLVSIISSGRIEDILKRINSSSEFDIPNYRGYYPVHAAVHRRSIQILGALLIKNANPNVVDMNKETILHKVIAMEQCSSNERIEFIRLLFNYGVDMNPRNKYGETPLHYACSIECLETIKTLVSFGSRHTITDNCYNFPIDKATKSKRKVIKKIFFEHSIFLNAWKDRESNVSGCLDPNISCGSIC